MVYPMHTCASPAGVPERPEKMSEVFGPGKQKTLSTTSVYTLRNYLCVESKYAKYSTEVLRCTDAWVGSNPSKVMWDVKCCQREGLMTTIGYTAGPSQ